MIKVRFGARAAACVAAGFAAIVVFGVPHMVCAATTAASASASANTIGCIDMKKVVAGYTKEAQSEADFQKIVDKFQDVWNTQKQNYMLSATDQQNLGNLLLKDNPTAADQAQIKQLETQSQSDATELTALQNKTSPTDSDKVRLAALTQEQQNSQQILQDAGNDYKQQLDAKNQAVSDGIEAEIRAAVASVAQAKGLTLVLDSSLAIYASNDVTQLVLTKLNNASK
jgi:Skp family chaperone for outer membrane proteins